MHRLIVFLASFSSLFRSLSLFFHPLFDSLCSHCCLSFILHSMWPCCSWIYISLSSITYAFSSEILSTWASAIENRMQHISNGNKFAPNVMHFHLNKIDCVNCIHLIRFFFLLAFAIELEWSHPSAGLMIFSCTWRRFILLTKKIVEERRNGSEILAAVDCKQCEHLCMWIESRQQHKLINMNDNHRSVSVYETWCALRRLLHQFK